MKKVVLKRGGEDVVGRREGGISIKVVSEIGG